jgi:hypothetical protein
MTSNNAVAILRELREEKAMEEQAKIVKEQTEMVKVVAFVAGVLGLAFFVSQIHQQKSKLRAKHANIKKRALNINI